VCVCDINTICLPLCCSVRCGHGVYATRQRGCRAQPGLDRLGTARFDPAGTNPSSPPLIHRAANKAERAIHYRRVAGFSDNDIEKSPRAGGKVREHDTLAYRGNTIWNCIRVPDRGEGWGDEGMSRAQAKETASARADPFPPRSRMWTQANPAFVVGAHFRYRPLQTSHFTSNLVCQHSIFRLILLSRSRVDIAIWFGHGAC